MHTTKIDEWTIHHDGGYSGTAIFIAPNGLELIIPISVIETLVANKIRDERIRWLEDAEPLDILRV